MKYYTYQGRVAKVEDSAAAAFLQQYPGAEESIKLQHNGRTATVPLSKVEAFRSMYPGATELGSKPYNPANDPIRRNLENETQDARQRVAGLSNEGAALNARVSTIMDQQKQVRQSEANPGITGATQLSTLQHSENLQEVDNAIDKQRVTEANRRLSNPVGFADPGLQDTYRERNQAQERIDQRTTEDVQQNNQSAADQMVQERDLLKSQTEQLLEVESWTPEQGEAYKAAQARIFELDRWIPAVQQGMTPEQLWWRNYGRDVTRVSPILSYAYSLGTSVLRVASSPYTLVTPSSQIADALTYTAQGLSEGDIIHQMISSQVASLPMNVAMIFAPQIAVPLTFTDIGSQNIKGYYDRGALDGTAIATALLSAAVQTGIEFMSSRAQIEAYRGAYRAGGQEMLQTMMQRDLAQMFNPTVKQLGSTLMEVGMQEGKEEVLQNLSDRLIRFVINDEPIPTKAQDVAEYIIELSLDFVGGFLGGAIMGGVGGTTNLLLNHNVMNTVAQLAPSSDAIMTLQEAISAIQSGDMVKAQERLHEAKRLNMAQPSDNKQIQQAFALATDAINYHNVQTINSYKAVNEELFGEIQELKSQANDLIRDGNTAESSVELYEIQQQIAEKEAIIKRNIREIQSDEELRNISTALQEAERSRIKGDSKGEEAAQMDAQGAMERFSNPMPEEPGEREIKEINPAVSGQVKGKRALPKQQQVQRPKEPSLTPEQIKQQKKDGTYIQSAQERAASNEKLELGESKGMSIGNPNETMNRTDPDSDKPEGVNTGKEVSVAVPNSKRVKVRYILVDRKSLITSNNNDFQENPEFPADLQNRNRDNAASKAQVMKIEAELDPYIVMDNPIAKDGAPIVIRDNNGRWIVLSGNGRMMGINRRADLRGAEAMQEYEEAVKERLEEFGFDPETDTTGKVLVRAYYGENDIIQMAQQLNTETAAKLSRVEMATSDATAIANLIRKGDNILDLLKVRSGDVLSASNADFLQEFLTKIIRTGGGDYQTSDGGWSDTMRTRVEMALISYVFNGDARAEKMLEGYYEAKDSKTKRLFKGIIDTIGEILKLRMLIEKHGLLDLDISQTVLDTILDIERLRQQGISLENALYETDLFSENRQAIPDSKRPLYIAMYNIKSQKAARDFFGSYYENAWDAISPEEYTLLSGTAETREQFLDDYLKEWNDEQAKKKDEPGAEESDAQDDQKVDGQASVSDTETSATGEQAQEVDSKPRNKPQTAGQILSRVDDKVAEDALLGMLPKAWTHDAAGNKTYTVSKQGRAMTIKFANGTEIVLNRLNGAIQVGDSKGIGRTRLETSKKGNLQVIIDLVDGYNAGNYTLFHEAFHTAWKLWLSAEQRQYLNGYFQRQFLAGKVKPNGISSRDWNLMKAAEKKAAAKELWESWSNSEKAEMLEEMAANHCEAWIGRRAEAVTIIERMWQKLLDRIRHFAVTIGIAPKGTTVKDIFWKAETGRLEGKGEAFEGKQGDRNKLVDEAVNQRFNEELNQFDNNELPQRHIFNLGKPGVILQQAGFPDASIEMLIGTLKDKIKNHTIKTELLRDLPISINDPIFVAKSKSKDKSLVIFTEIEHDDGNIIVAVSIDKTRNGAKINDIRSIYGKNSENIIAWFRDDQDQFVYLNKEKSLSWLNRSAGSQSRKLAQTTKAIYKINENVGLSSKKFEEVRKELQIGEFEPNSRDTRYKQLEEKNLVTIHNLEIANLEKSIASGGMPMPSIAIVDIEKTNHKEFGEVSLIASPEILDIGRKNPVYTQDAWTPNYPTIRHEVSKDSRDQLKGVVKAIQAIVPDAKKSGFAELTELYLEQNINDKGYENALCSYLDHYWNNENSADLAEREAHHEKARRKARQLAKEYPVKTSEMIRTTNDRNGNARYVPNTMDNVMKHMERQRSDDGSVHEINHLIGKLAPRLTSISQVQKNRGRLTSEEGRQEVYNRIEQKIKDLTAYAKEHRKQFNWWEEAQVIEDLHDLATRGLGYVKTEYDASTDFSKFYDAIREIQSQPSNIFEAKPRKIVKLNEFAAAVIPSGTKAATQKALKNAGLKVVRYEAGNDDARYEAVKKISQEMGVRYKISDTASFDEIAEEYSKWIDSGHKFANQELRRKAYAAAIQELGIVMISQDIDRGGAHNAPGAEMAPAWNLASGVYPEDVYSYNGLLYYGTGEDRMDSQAYSILMELEGKPNATVKIYRAVEADYKGKINPGDWVTIIRGYAKDHGEGNIPGGYRIISKTVNARDIFTAGDSWLEWGYHPQKAFPFRIVKKDADGKLIPISQREDYQRWKKEAASDRYKLAPDSADIQEAERQMEEVRKQYQGTDKWLKAPNGKPTKLNERQWLQVRTENFKKWFGDWENDPANASKVIDENGEPMVVYHGGASKSFSVFKYTKDDNTAGSKAIFFTNSNEVADSYAASSEAGKYNWDESGPNVYPVFLRIINPGIRDAKGQGGNGGGSSSIRGAVKKAVYDGNDGVIVRNVIDEVDYEIDYEKSDEEGAAYKYRTKDKVQDLYVVFGNTQIKSATANVGRFDAENPDIRYKLQDHYHGSGAFFDRFDLNYIGTGEGYQAFGWGIYITEPEENGRYYANTIGGDIPARIQIYDPLTRSTIDERVNINDKNDIDRFSDNLWDYVNNNYYVFDDGNDVLQAAEVFNEYMHRLLPVLLKEETNNNKQIVEDTYNTMLKERSNDNKSMDKLRTIYLLLMRASLTPQRKGTGRNLYKVTVWENRAEDVLEWYKPVKPEQMDKINSQLEKEGKKPMDFSKWRDPTGELLYEGMLSTAKYYSTPKAASQFLLRAGIDGIKYPVNALSGGTGEKGWNYVVFDDSQIQITEHIRYKMLDDDYVIARLEAAKKMIANFNADPEKISEEIAETKGLDPEQVKEKLGRQIKAAYRETAEQWQTLLAASRVAGVDEFVAQNKPGTTDRSDLTFHLSEAEQIAMYEQHIGLSLEEAMKSGEDRYSFYLGGLRIFARGNALMQEWMETKKKISDMAEQGKTDAAMEQHLAHLTAMIQESSLSYSNLTGQAGRILRHAREQKTQMLANYNKMIQTLEVDSAEIYKRIAEEQAEIAELEKLVIELDKEIATLEEMVQTTVVSGAKALKHAVDSALKKDRYSSLTAAEELEALQSRREALKSHLNTRIAHVKALQEQVTASADQISELSKQVYYLKPGKKPSIKDVKPRKMYTSEWAQTLFYNNILAGLPTHILNLSSNVFNAILEQALVNTVLTPKAGIHAMGSSLGSFFKALGFNHNELDEPGFYQTLIDPSDYAKKWEMGQLQSFLSKPGKNGKPKIDFPLLRLANMTLTIMAAEDQFFKYGNMKAQMTSLAYLESRRTKRPVKELMQYPTQDMIIQANYEATKNSFNQNPEGLIGGIVNQVDTFYKWLGKKGPYGRWSSLALRIGVMPFTRIVGNVLNATIDWTPFGIVRAWEYASKNPNSMVNEQMNIWKNKDGTLRVSPYARRNMTRQITRVTLGTLLIGILFAMIKPWEEDKDKMGIISGSGPEDYEKRKQLIAMGWAPYSIKIGNRWISYVDTPLAGALSIMGNIHDYYAYNQATRPKNIMELTGFAVMGMGDSFLQRSFLSSAREAIIALDRKDEKWLFKKIASTVTIPASNNFLRFLESLYNSDVHSPATLTQFIRLSVPFMPKEDIAKAINVYGNGEVRRSPFSRLVGVPAVGNETLVIVDRFGQRKDMRDVTETILNAGLKVPNTRAYEVKLADDQYVWLEGQHKQRFQELRGLDLAMHIYEKQGKINRLARAGEIDELSDLLRSIGTKATREAKRQLLSERRSQLERQTIYSKSRDHEGD